MADVTINQLTGQAPTNTDVFPFSTTGVTPSTYKATLAQIKTALAIPAAQIQSDWNQTSSASLDFIKNKPTVGIGGIQLFTSSGTFTVPAGVTKIEAHLVGGGGGGGARFNVGIAGTASSITGFDIIANGGQGNGNNVGGVGGTTSGALRLLSINGNNTGCNVTNQSGWQWFTVNPADNRGWYQYGGEGHRPLGFQSYGGGGIGTPGNPGGNTGWAGAGGGYAMGILTVTPGQTLTINVGTGGASGGTSGSGPGQNGVVILKW